MKNSLLVLVSIFFLVSCDNSKKFEGKWTQDLFKINDDKLEDLPSRITIENDSIKFDFYYFQHEHTYPFEINNGKLHFNEWSIETKIIEDTLCLNNMDFYIRDEEDSIHNNWWGNPITKITLPKLKSVNNKANYKTTIHDHYDFHILFGKRLDNGKFSLQLNDQYASFSDLPEFASQTTSCIGGEIGVFPSATLFLDRTSPMNYVEDIFYHLAIVNKLKVKLINDINLRYNDSVGLYYNLDKLTKRISYFFSNSGYSIKKSNLPQPPPLFPQPPNYKENLESKFIYLKKDKLYYDDKAISSSELKTLIKPWIENNNVIFSLYDLESTYGPFLEMNAIINSVYQEVRESVSNHKYKLPFKELTREQTTEIKTEVPMHHVWSFSIPHFNHVVQQKNDFFGLKINENL